LGEKQVKNIAGAVRAYRVLLDPAAAGTMIIAQKKALRSRRWPAIGMSVLLLPPMPAVLSLVAAVGAAVQPGTAPYPTNPR
jgi:hypothetical protein